MKRRTLDIVLSLGLSLLACGPFYPILAQGPPYETNIVVETFAGSGFYGLVDGLGEETMFNAPGQLAHDKSLGVTYVLDTKNKVVRKISSAAEVTTLNLGSYAEGVTQIGCDDRGNVFFTHSTSLFLTPSSGLQGNQPAQICSLSRPATNYALATFPDGRVLLADKVNNKILIADPSRPGDSSVYAGSGNPGHVDGHGVFCSFYHPTGIAASRAGDVFVAEEGSSNVRHVTTNLVVTTLGSLSWFNDFQPFVADEQGGLYWVYGASVLKRYPDGGVVMIAGDWSQSGYLNAAGPEARFRSPQGIVLTGASRILVADAGDHRIRKIFMGAAGERPLLSGSMRFGINLVGIPGKTYRIEAAPTSTGSWSTVATLTLPTPEYLWVDPRLTNAAYYRSVLVK